MKRWTMGLLSVLGVTSACQQGTEPAFPAEGSCAYPEGAVEPMAEGEVLAAYSWPEAIHLDGRTATLELSEVPCAGDDDIDWSPFDVLLFVSLPAW